MFQTGEMELPERKESQPQPGTWGHALGDIKDLDVPDDLSGYM